MASWRSTCSRTISSVEADGDTALGLTARRLPLPPARASGRATVLRGRADDFAALA